MQTLRKTIVKGNDNNVYINNLQRKTINFCIIGLNKLPTFNTKVRSACKSLLLNKTCCNARGTRTVRKSDFTPALALVIHMAF